MSFKPAPVGYIYIYALIDPRDNTRRYVGQAVNVDQAYRKLLYAENFAPEIELGLWLVALTNLGYYPTVEVLPLVKEGWERQISEILIVGRYRKGWPLVNLPPKDSTLPPKPLEWAQIQLHPIDLWPDKIRYAMMRERK